MTRDQLARLFRTVHDQSMGKLKAPIAETEQATFDMASQVLNIHLPHLAPTADFGRLRLWPV